MSFYLAFASGSGDQVFCATAKNKLLWNNIRFKKKKTQKKNK